MKDIYRELLKRSYADVVALSSDIGDEYGYSVPSDALPQMALALYHHRVQQHHFKVMDGQYGQEIPSTDPNIGKQ